MSRWSFSFRLNYGEKPVAAESRLMARARVMGEPGRKNTVLVTVTCEDVPVFEARFSCPVLERHVLA